MIARNIRRLFGNKCRNYINGKWVEPANQGVYKVLNPATQELINEVPETTQQEFDAAISSAKSAYKQWSQTSVLSRQRYMFDYLTLLKENHSKLADIITAENGKTFLD